MTRNATVRATGKLMEKFLFKKMCLFFKLTKLISRIQCKN